MPFITVAREFEKIGTFASKNEMLPLSWDVDTLARRPRWHA